MIPGITAGTMPPTAHPSVLSVSGVYSDIYTDRVTVPSGAEVDDLLVLFWTRGAIGNKNVPAEFTPIYEGASGAVGVRTMQSGDKNFSLGQTGYASLISINKSVGIPSVDVSGVTDYTTAGPYHNPTVTPTSSTDLALMLFFSANGAMKSPAPAYTNLITYNSSGAGGCGLAASFTILNNTNPFAGTSCGGTATTGFPASALTLLIK